MRSEEGQYNLNKRRVKRDNIEKRVERLLIPLSMH
jgi:hypothetical protein